ncbi:hypothetical protein AgCh_017209 [Apium graveolens]
MEFIASHGESSIRGAARTPTLGVPVGGLFGSPGGERNFQNGGPGGTMGGDGDFEKEERLEAVVITLERDALKWYQWENKRHPIRRWVDLKGRGVTRAYNCIQVFEWGQSKSRGGEIRRLSHKELQEKCSKGLWFRWDEKWNIGHKCRKRELSVLLIDEDGDDSSEEAGSEPPPSPTEETPSEIHVQSEVSLNSVFGLSCPRTKKLKGEIADKEVIVLIDPGATHNFVSLEKVAALGLPVTESGGFGVSLGNGEAIKESGVCENVVLQLDGDVIIQEDFLPLKLDTTDISYSGLKNGGLLLLIGSHKSCNSVPAIIL